MKKEFFHGTSRGMRIAFSGFIVALIGVVAGFVGFYVNERWLSMTGFTVTAAGVLIGFAGVVHGWIYNAKRAIKGSTQAADELSSKLPRWSRKSGSD
jgi:hypothetical protein